MLSMHRIFPAAALAGFVLVVILVKWWVDRGPGPLEWRDGAGNRPERVDLPKRIRELETEKAPGVLPEAFPSSDPDRTEDD